MQLFVFSGKKEVGTGISKLFDPGLDHSCADTAETGRRRAAGLNQACFRLLNGFSKSSFKTLPELFYCRTPNRPQQGGARFVATKASFVNENLQPVGNCSMRFALKLLESGQRHIFIADIAKAASDCSQFGKRQTWLAQVRLKIADGAPQPA